MPDTNPANPPVSLAHFKRQSLMRVAMEKYIAEMTKARDLLLEQSKAPDATFAIGNPAQGGIHFTGETAKEIFLALHAFVGKLAIQAEAELKAALSDTAESA